MKTSRPRTSGRGWTALTLSGCLAISAVNALGQERLDPSFYSNTNLWNNQERQQVNRFVEQAVGRLQSGEEADIAEGKNKLNAELTVPGANERFISQLSEVVTQSLEPLVDSPDVKVRINTMIVSANLRTPRALDLVLNGLADDNAGVRYLASKAMEGLLLNGRLPDAERTRALDRLGEIIVNEGEVFVARPMLEALVQANANARVLTVLNQRVPLHARRPNADYGPEASTFRELFSSLFVDNRRSPAELRELGRASARYLLLIAQQEQASPGLAENDPSRVELLRIAVRALELAHTDLRVGTALPPANRAVETRNWSELLAAGQSWQEMLQEAPFNFEPGQVSVAAE